MRFRGLDLNLVAALDVLLAEKNVSRSAERLGLSQPAMSAALQRLRDYFRDELLVQHGRRLFATPFANMLQPQLSAFLRAAEGIAAASSVFDCATTSRTFRILASDFVLLALLAPFICEAATAWPGLGFDISPLGADTDQHLQNGRADLLITPSEFLVSDLPTELLFEERHVVVGADDHPIFVGEVTEEAMFACGHVGVQIGANRDRVFVDRHLERLGKFRRLEVFTSSFASVPWLLVGTRRLAIMHERLAREMVGQLPIAFAPLPFDFPLMREMMQHHHARDSDEGLAWLRRQLTARGAAAI